ncbi:hypothetical protein JO972_16660 [Verrucomicrobiaceae bacterium 5K15]|uniref:Uncharacterized protein n=1 Tax=Oceaniferula flava TaxID=2800421 RepID=A0AAE2SEY4_9BACT|nr:hypothetical protein [Oceaniferula flavus]MBK1856598.1 hypothetical protein [Oceaniferula flavus]MBM1137906.1 hypothetical protein [Oceaniferula flavus]
MKKYTITFILFIITLNSVLCSAEPKELPQWQKSLFSSDYCFIAEVVEHPDDGFHILKPHEFFWGKHDEFIKARLKVSDHPIFPMGSLFFLHYTRHPDGSLTKYYSRLKKSRKYEETSMVINMDDKKMKIKDFRQLALQRPRKK